MGGRKAELREETCEVGAAVTILVSSCCIIFLFLVLFALVPHNGIEDASEVVKGDCFGRLVTTENSHYGLVQIQPLQGLPGGPLGAVGGPVACHATSPQTHSCLTDAPDGHLESANQPKPSRSEEEKKAKSRCVNLLVGVHGHCGSWTAFFPLVESVLFGTQTSGGGRRGWKELRQGLSNEHEWHAYALDFNSEATALHPWLVETQAEFLIRSLKRLLKNYAAIDRKVCHVALVGHSFGGVAIARALTKRRSKNGCFACSEEDELDLTALDVLSVFFVNTPLGGHPVLQNLGMGWLYRHLHADLAALLRPSQSLRQVEEHLLDGRVLLPPVVGMFALTSGHLDQMVPADVATLPPFTPVITPSAFRLYGKLHAAQQRLYSIQKRRLKGAFADPRSRVKGREEDGFQSDAGFDRKTRVARASDHWCIPFIFYLRLPLQKVAIVQEASCHDCPLLTPSSLNLLSRLLHLQAVLARRLRAVHGLRNPFSFYISKGTHFLQPAQRSPVAIRRHLRAIQAKKGEFHVLLEHLNHDVIPLVESGIVQLLPWRRLQRQEESLTQLLETLAAAQLNVADIRSVLAIVPSSEKAVLTKSFAFHEAQESCTLDGMEDLPGTIFGGAKNCKVPMIVEEPTVAANALMIHSKIAAIRASLAFGLPVAIADLVSLTTETRILLRRALKAAHGSEFLGKVHKCTIASSASPFCLLAGSFTFLQSPDTSSEAEGFHYLCGNRGGYGISADGYLDFPPLFSQLRLRSFRPRQSAKELCDLRFLKGVKPSERMRLDYLNKGLRLYLAQWEHDHSRPSELLWQNAEKELPFSNSLLFLAVNMPPGVDSNSECSVDALKLLALRGVHSSFNPSSAEDGESGLFRLCFFAVQPSVTLEFPLGACGWTFDGAASVLLPNTIESGELVWEERKARCEPERQALVWWLVVLNMEALSDPSEKAVISMIQQKAGSTHGKNNMDGETLVYEESRQREASATPRESVPTAKKAMEFPWRGETFRFEHQWLQWLQPRFPLLHYLVSFFWPLKAKVVTRGQKGATSEPAPAFLVTREGGGTLGAVFVWLPFSRTVAHLTPLDVTVSVHCIASSGEPIKNSKNGSQHPAAVWLALCDAVDSDMCSLKRVVTSSAATQDFSEKMLSSKAETQVPGGDNAVGSSASWLISWAKCLFRWTGHNISAIAEFFGRLGWQQGSSAKEFAVRLSARSAVQNAPRPLPRFPQGIPEQGKGRGVYLDIAKGNAVQQSLLEADTVYSLARIGELAAEALQKVEVRKSLLQEYMWQNILLVVIPDQAPFGGRSERETDQCGEGGSVVFELEAKASFYAAARSVLVLYFPLFLSFVSSAVALFVAFVYLHILVHLLKNPCYNNAHKDICSDETARVGAKQTFDACQGRCRRLLRQANAIFLSLWITATRDLSCCTVSPLRLIWGNRTGKILYLAYAIISSGVSYILHSPATRLDKKSLWELLLYGEPLTAFVPVQLPITLQMLLQLISVLVVCSAVELLLRVQFLALKDALWRLFASLHLFCKYMATSFRFVLKFWNGNIGGSSFVRRQSLRGRRYHCGKAVSARRSFDSCKESTCKGTMLSVCSLVACRCRLFEFNSGSQWECICHNHSTPNQQASSDVRSASSDATDTSARPFQCNASSIAPVSCSGSKTGDGFTTVTAVAGPFLVFAAACIPHVMALFLVPLYAFLLILESSVHRCGCQGTELCGPSSVCVRCTNAQRKIQTRASLVIPLYIQPLWLLTLIMSSTFYFILQSFDLHLTTEDGKSLLAGPDKTIRHLFQQSTLTQPPLADSVLNVFVSHLRRLLNGSKTSAGSSSESLDIMDQISVFYFVCLLPLCLFASKRLQRISGLYCRNPCNSCLAGCDMPTGRKVSNVFSNAMIPWRSMSLQTRFAFCALQQILGAILIPGVTEGSPIRLPVILAISILFSLLLHPA